MQAVQLHAIELLGQLAQSDANKHAIRDQNGILSLLKLLDRGKLNSTATEAVLGALAVLATNNEINQDHIRYHTATSVLSLPVWSAPCPWRWRASEKRTTTSWLEHTCSPDS